MKRLLIISVLLIFACWICATCLHGAVPTFESFPTNQYQTNGLQVYYRAVHTNDAGIVYPSLDNTLTLTTNENVYGTFSLPAKVTLLTLGTNYLDLSTNTTWLLNSPTNDASQVIISLSAGAYQGQLALITSQNGAEAFTLPNLSEQWDVPGAVVWLSGVDWIGTTNRGILMQYTAPDWVAMWRFDPSGGGGGSVLGSGTAPYIPYWSNATTLTNSPLLRSNNWTIMLESTNTTAAGKFLIQGPSSTAVMDLTGDGTTAHFQGGTVGAYLANAAGFGVISLATAFVPTVNNTLDLGASGSLRWKNLSLDGYVNWNGSTNSLQDTWGYGSPEGVVTAFPGSFYRDSTGSFYGKTNGTGNTGWGLLSAGSAGTIINPTDDFVPYRIDATSFGNSNIKRISTNEWHSFGATGRKITQAIGGTGILSFERFLIGNSAVDPLIGLSLVGNLVSLPVSINVDGLNAPLATHLVYIGGDSAPRTITNTPAISTAYEINGIHSIFIGKSDVNTVTFQDQSVSPGSHLALKAATRTLGSNDVLELVFLSVITNWVEIGFHSATAGGSALWASAGGVLYPSPAVDVVSITSQLADNATNVALVVDSSVPWSSQGATSLLLQNGSVNNLVFSANGAIIEGANTVANAGISIFTDDNYYSVRDTALGDKAQFGIHAFVIDGAGNWDGFETYGGTNFNALYLYSGSTNGANCWWRLLDRPDPDLVGDPIADDEVSTTFYWRNRLGTKPLFLRPDIGDHANSVAYTLGTTYPLSTAGSLIAAFHNGFTNKFTVSNLGAITLAGTTNQVVFGSTNTAPASAVAPTKWISVQVTGDAGVYRVPLYE